MLRKSRHFRTLVLAVALSLELPGAALAQSATPAPPSAMPRNSVECAYALMSPEDREMALLLFEREVSSTVISHTGSRNLKVIDRLVSEAHAKCALAYNWSSGRSDAAIGYAMNALMSTGLTQAIEAKGHSTVPIDAYYTKHRAELVGTETIAGPQAEDFRAYLFERDWTKSETLTLRIAEFYLEALLTGARQTTTFAAAAAHPAAARQAKTSRQPVRARTTERGKP